MTSSAPSAAVRVGESIVRRVRSAVDPLTTLPAGQGPPGDGWLAVTVLCETFEIDPSRLPAPLAELGDAIEVAVTPAPADRGTELRARLRDTSSSDSPARRLSGSDSRSELRSALREAKQVIEVGEVLRVDPAPHGERTATPGGLLLEAWTRVAPKGGVL